MGRSSVYHRLRAARRATAPSLWRGRIVLGRTRMMGRGDDGPAVYTYEAVPGVPPVSTIRFGRKLPPGEVVGVGDDPSSLHEAEGWGVFFLPEVLGPQTPGAFLSWRAHPLLFP